MQTVALVGLESVGKSALFRALTGFAAGDETNFRGSTVHLRKAKLQGTAVQVVDTPGIRVETDSITTQLALQQLKQSDMLLLVVRGTHVHQEIGVLMNMIGAEANGRKCLLVVTFADKASAELQTAVSHYQQLLGIPLVLVNARQMSHHHQQQVRQAISQAAPFRPHPIKLPAIPIIHPQQTVYEHPIWGPWFSILTIFLLFTLPVYLAYLCADSLQPWVDTAVITPLITWLDPVATFSPLLHAVLVGNYGVITLGWYSFLWAFPVVLFISFSVAITEEMGLKDRITAALDPWLRQIGLNGRDLIPVLTGFGCNVVAVFQSRGCSQCTRKACVSMIAFGSACSYQIGASLSLFSSAGQSWLFIPYLILLFVVGAIHTRMWHKTLPASAVLPLSDRAFLQRPTWRAMRWRVQTTVKQFLGQAMPIFLAICVTGAILEYGGVLDMLTKIVTPVLRVFDLPAQTAPGIIFSILRKDGLLILNQGGGSMLAGLTTGQLFVLVYLASTLTACLVTLWTVRREVGGKEALALAGRQAVTSVVSSWVLVLVV